MKIAVTIVALLVIGTVVGLLIDFGFVGLLLALMFIGLVVTKEGLDRQLRIMQMKRFRNSVRADKLDLTAEDKRTMI